MDRARRTGFLLLLGGLGGDSHSVGLLVLRRALEEAGYRVGYLSTQNAVERFVEGADAGADAVLVSNMDGHAVYYLQSVACMPEGALWYLGGNPVLDARAEEELRGKGFHRIYTERMTPDAVIKVLDADLAARTPRSAPARAITVAARARPASWLGRDEARDDTLARWPTGRAARDLEANARVLASRPLLSKLQAEAAQVLVQPRCGVAGRSEQRALFGRLAESGADVLSFQVDSLTRNAAYEAVAKVLTSASPHLNGYPVVNHGVDAIREMGAALDRPLQTRHSAFEPRLMAEISFAGGVSSFEGGPISYNLPYYPDLPLAVSLARWRQVDALTGTYAREFGIVLDREFFGPLTSTLVPPCISVAICVLEALLAARQGVLSVSLGYAEQGNRVQDVAAIRAMARLGREVLDARGHGDVRVHTVFHQYMGAFPPDRADAEELLFESARTARAARATRMLVKTASEATSIPTAEINQRALDIAARALALRPPTLPPSGLAAEEELIVRSARAMVDATLALGGGDPAAGIERAFQGGLLDVPFSPSEHNTGRVVTGRDAEGAVRFVSIGSLPLPDDVRAFHEERLGRQFRRLSSAARCAGLVDDVTRPWRGRGEGWPLSASVWASEATEADDRAGEVSRG